MSRTQEGAMSSVRRLSLVLARATATALAVTPPAHARRTMKLKVPRFVVPPRSDREVCTFVRLPMRKTFDLGGSVIANVGMNSTFTSHHFLIWVYNGTDLNAFPPKGQLVDSKACLDFGPTDTNRRTLIGGPPGQKTSVHWDWRPKGLDFGGSLGGGAFPKGPACVTSLTSHMHKRGTLFTIEFLDGSTVVECGPQGTTTCLTATDYADPPQIPFDPPLLVNVGQGLRYTCTH